MRGYKVFAGTANPEFAKRVAKHLSLPLSAAEIKAFSDGEISVQISESVRGKDVFIIDDMISSGESMLDVARELKERKAKRIFLAATFGLFTNGMAKFDEAHESGLFDKILTTNLVYQSPELLSRDYYISVDMSKYIALLIDTLNHDASISDLLNPVERINKRVNAYKESHK